MKISIFFFSIKIKLNIFYYMRTNYKSIILFGSANSNGHTKKALNTIIGERDEKNKLPIVDLNSLNITQYDYQHKNSGDDFLPLMEKVMDYEVIALATPVYWYSTSTVMKLFLDRWTDLLKIAKDLGRKLRGKKLFIIASYGSSIPEGFEVMFQQFCSYLDMEYLGTSFIYSGSESLALKARNSLEIEKARKYLFSSSPSV